MSSPVTEPTPQARVWRQPPIKPRRMASMLTGPMGAAAANPMKNAAESTWMSEMITVSRQARGISPKSHSGILAIKNIHPVASHGAP